MNFEEMDDEYFRLYSIPVHFRTMTINSFIDRCGGDPGKSKAIESVASYIKNGGFIMDNGVKKTGIVLSGDYGVGKTGLLTSALIALDSARASNSLIPTLWLDAYDFIKDVESFEADNFRDLSSMDEVRSAGFVLLDGLGDKDRQSPESSFVKDVIFRTINYRHNNGLPMLITTNLTTAEMSLQFGQRTVERIIESCAWVKVGGDNLRLF